MADPLPRLLHQDRRVRVDFARVQLEFDLVTIHAEEYGG